MTQPADESASRSETAPPAKKPYTRPAFRYERVFETRALSCGKVNASQGQCANNRKSS